MAPNIGNAQLDELITKSKFEISLDESRLKCVFLDVRTQAMFVKAWIVCVTYFVHSDNTIVELANSVQSKRMPLWQCTSRYRVFKNGLIYSAEFSNQSFLRLLSVKYFRKYFLVSLLVWFDRSTHARNSFYKLTVVLKCSMYNSNIVRYLSLTVDLRPPNYTDLARPFM